MTDKQNDAVHYFKQKFLAEWKTINPSKVIKTAYGDITGARIYSSSGFFENPDIFCCKFSI